MSLANTYVTATDEYAAFVQAAFHFQSRRINTAPTPGALPNVEAMLYLDAKGRVALPPATPFIPVGFTVTPTNKRARLDRMWIDCCGLLADEFLKQGLHGQISLPPEITDIRPFMWKGFVPGLRYTFMVDFPFDATQLDPAVRKQVAKTMAAGYVCRRAGKADVAAIMGCIRQTERRQGFSYHVSESVLEKGLEIVGEDRFRMYVAMAPGGSVASCRVVLHAAGGTAIDWIAATATEHLKSGATQAAIQFALQDLEASGAKNFDFAGAGLPTVSAAKACWGGRLTAYATIQQQTLKSLAVQMYMRMRTRDKKREEKPEKKSAEPVKSPSETPPPVTEPNR